VIAPESTARCFLCEAIDASARPCLAGRVCGPCWVDASRTATSDLGRRVREFRPRIGSMTISRAIATALPAMEQRIQASLDLLAILEHRGRRPGPDPIDLEALVTELRRLGESATLPRRFGGEPWMKRGDCTRCGRDRQIHHIEGAEELCAACWQCDPASHRTCRRCGAHEYLSYYGICRPCRATDRLASMFTADRLAVHPQLRGPYERLRSSDGRYLASGVLNRSTTKLLRRLLDAGRINHAGLDALGTPAQTRVLRAFLVDSGALPFRDDRLHALEHWIEDTATGLGGADRGTFIRFARWRALRLARLAPMTEGQAAGKRRELAMIRDLLHIVADDGSTLRTMRQAQLDSWLASRPVAARPIVMFIRWCRTSGINTTLTVPMTPKVAWSPGPALTESERLDRLAQVLHPDIDFAPELRLAAGLVMLYAIRPHRIANLARAAIINGPGGVTITLGTDPLLLPEPLDQIALEAVDARTIRRYGGPADDSEWLFPSPLAGRPIHPGTLSARLRAIGIDPRAARNTALADLALRLPPAVVGRLIGVRPRTASRWGGAANQAQAAYAADRASAGASPEPTD
jgi:hypothetical protein